MISLARDCIAEYIIWHEVMHAIGFEHEHQRPDRDKFIRVEYSNVQPGQMGNFEKLSPYEVDYPDTYDYNSIMHYDSHAFGRRDPSKNSILATMIPLKEGVKLDDNLKMSPTDIRKLRRLGKCDGSGESESSTQKAQDKDICVDVGADCERMKKNGLCMMPFYRRLMLKNCAKTCHLCAARSPGAFENVSLPVEAISLEETTAVSPPFTSECKDEDHRCASHARNSFCINPFYKRQRAMKCAKTCGLC